MRNKIERDYVNIQLGSGSVGGCFGSILCHELHHGGNGDGLHFKALDQKWNISISFLGRVISDHCDRLDENELLPVRKWTGILRNEEKMPSIPFPDDKENS